jgi:hypothetical protein
MLFNKGMFMSLAHDAYKKIRKEYILCSAIWYKELPKAFFCPINVTEGCVICGFRHGSVIGTLCSITGKRSVKTGADSIGEYEQGFLTSLNRFVNRKEAGSIAFEAGQIEESTDCLFSEDLW